jgi:hypothetical protein
MIGAKHSRGDGHRPNHISTHRQLRIEFLDVPPSGETSRLDIDLPGRLGDENTVVSYRVEARSPAASRAVEALPIPPTSSVLW